MTFSRIKALIVGGSALLALASSAGAQQASQPFALHNGDRVVFYGDSITEQRLYTNFIEQYVVTRFPTMKESFVNSGWGGDTVLGGGGGPIDLRLDRDVIPYKPTMMTIMLGMNDGHYHGPDQKTFDTYSAGYKHIISKVQAALPGLRMTLIGPSAYDDVTQPVGFPGGYNAVLQQYAQFVEQTAQADHLGFADMNAPMVAMLEKANATDHDVAQKIIPGRVHPSPAGHLIMAEAVLKAWNAPSLVTDVAIDAAGGHIVKADNSKISNLKTGKSVSWTETDGALPMPVAWSDPTVALVLKSSDFVDALDQEMLHVSGLNSATNYSLTIDGHDAGKFTGEQLAAGINLAPLPTPMERQAAAVADLVNQHVSQHYTRWRTIQVPLENMHDKAVDKALPPLLKALDAEEAETEAKAHAAAQPVAHQYEISPALPDPTGPDLALNKPYTSNATNTYGWADGLTDGSWETVAGHTFATDDSDNFPKTATIDLGQSETLDAVRIGVPGFGSTKTVGISLSTDGQKFTEAGKYVFSLNFEEKHLFRFAPTSARYIRLTYLDHYDESVGYTPTFAFTTEVEAFGPDS